MFETKRKSAEHVGTSITSFPNEQQGIFFEYRENLSEILTSDSCVRLLTNRNKISTHAKFPWIRNENQPFFQYFEIKMIKLPHSVGIQIGVAAGQLPSYIMPGKDKNSFGYSSVSGFFQNDRKIYSNSYPYHEGDVVGCGLLKQDDSIFYTLNGKFIGSPFKLRQNNLDYYPFIGFSSDEDGENAVIEVQFKGPFKYNLSKIKKDFKSTRLKKRPIDYYLRKMAKRGCVKCQYYLGLLYYKGDKEANINVNYNKAFSYFMQSAKLGYVKAQYAIGRHFAHGRGVKQNFKEASKWYALAHSKGYSKATTQLGFIFYKGGCGITKDFVKAKMYLENAAGKNKKTAYCGLGKLYYYGLGVQKDFKMALFYFEKAAELGHVHSMHNAAVMYYKGKGVPVDYNKALQWLHKAADKDCKESQYLIGRCYKSGKGVKKDLLLAHYWIEKCGDSKSKVQAEIILKDFMYLKKQMFKDHLVDSLSEKFVDIIIQYNI